MPFSRHAMVRAGSHDIHVAEMGAETGRPVVLLHGNPDTHTVWETTCSRLVARDGERLRCIAPDLPGFGKTPPAGVSLEEQSEWVEALLDGLRLDRVDLVVHDVGGPYGLSFATVHASRLRSLTICNTLYSRDYRWHFWARIWRRRGIGELAMKIANRPLFVREMRRGSPNIPRDYVERAWKEFTPATRAHVLTWYRAMNPEVMIGWDERFLDATADTVKSVVWGDLDPYIPAVNADRLGAPASNVHHIPSAGHWVMLEEPDRVADIIAMTVARAA